MSAPAPFAPPRRLLDDDLLETVRSRAAGYDRDNAYFTEDMADLTAAGVRYNEKTPQQMTIEARVHDASGQVVLAHVGAVVNMSSAGDGLRLYRWYDSIFGESDSPGASSPGETS